jgi:hypothetical protein
MIFSKKIRFFLVIFFHNLDSIESHGRLNEPASRNSAWRFGYNTPPNYNDNELNCGGAGQQHSVNS